MKKLRYFAYGSNLLLERINARLCWRRNEKLNVVGVHKLYGYKLVFNVSGLVDNSFANIVPSAPTDYVEGVLYDITSDQSKELDRFEGFYDKEYFITNDGNIAVVYVGKPDLTMFKNKPPLPEIAYLNAILDGCLQHGLTYTYNKLVDFKLANYKVRSRHKRI